MVGIRLVVEGFYLTVSIASVQFDGLVQGTVCLESKYIDTPVAGVTLQHPQETAPQSKPARLWRNPHPLQLGRRARMKLERPTADWPTTQTGDEQDAGGWLQLARVGGDAERWVKAGLEARAELGEVLLDAPPGVGRGWILDREAHHGRAKEPLDLRHRRHEPRALVLAERLQETPGDIIRASIKLGPFG